MIILDWHGPELVWYLAFIAEGHQARARRGRKTNGMTPGKIHQKAVDVISQLSNDQLKSGLEIVIGRFPALLATKE